MRSLTLDTWPSVVLLTIKRSVTRSHLSGKIHWFLFIALLVVLLLNLLIAMMGDTYAKGEISVTK